MKPTPRSGYLQSCQQGNNGCVFIPLHDVTEHHTIIFADTVASEIRIKSWFLNWFRSFLLPPCNRLSSLKMSANMNNPYYLFMSSFPNGWNELAVSGRGLLCGLRAVIRSLKAQHPGMPKPTEENLYDTYMCLDRPTTGRINVNNFYADQLGATLYFWGVQHDLNLRLGYILADGRCNLIGTPADEGNPTTIWITTTSSTGVTEDNSMDHYSGIARHISGRPAKTT